MDVSQLIFNINVSMTCITGLAKGTSGSIYSTQARGKGGPSPGEFNKIFEDQKIKFHSAISAI